MEFFHSSAKAFPPFIFRAKFLFFHSGIAARTIFSPDKLNMTGLLIRNILIFYTQNKNQSKKQTNSTSN